MRLYRRTSKTAPWVQLGPDIQGEAAGDASGRSIALSADGSIVAIGAAHNDAGNGFTDDRGHVRVYEYDAASNNWVQLGSDIDGQASGDRFGTSVSLSGDGSTLAVGAEHAGYVKVYGYASSSWTVELEAVGEINGDRFGRSVALSDNGLSLAIGAPHNDAGIIDHGIDDDRGHVVVYRRISNTAPWAQLGSDIDGESSGDWFGWSVALSAEGLILAVGAIHAVGSGHVRVYEYDANINGWAQMGSDIDGEASGDASGFSVALSDDGLTLAVGAPHNDAGNGIEDSGHVRVYGFDATNGASWEQLGADIDGEAANDASGWALALSGDGLTLAVGAPYNDGANGVDSGHVRVYGFEVRQTVVLVLASSSHPLPNSLVLIHLFPKGAYE